MKEINQLLKKNTRVWIYLADDETIDLFLGEVEREGFRFEDGEVPRKRRTDMYALHKCKINTLYFIGHLALQNQVKYIGTERLEIVDYRKYVNGEDTYVLN